MTRAGGASPTTQREDLEHGSSTGNENGTAAPSGNSKTGPIYGHAPSSSPSTPTTMSLSVRWESLSAEAAWVAVNIALPMSSGASTKELAGRLGESQKWVEAQLENLRRELASPPEHVGQAATE